MTQSLEQKILEAMIATKGRDEALANTKCPSCDMSLPNATAADGSDKRPSPGDVTVCINFGDILSFTDDLSLQKADDETLIAIAGSEAIKASLAIAAAYRKSKR